MIVTHLSPLWRHSLVTRRIKRDFSIRAMASNKRAPAAAMAAAEQRERIQGRGAAASHSGKLRARRTLARPTGYGAASKQPASSQQAASKQPASSQQAASKQPANSQQAAGISSGG
jgi:hypothetical protein